MRTSRPSPPPRLLLPSLAVLVAVALAGCLATPEPVDPGAAVEAPLASYTHLSAPGARETLDLDGGVRVFVFDGMTTTPATRALVASVPPGAAFLDESFDVDASVGYLEVLLDQDAAQPALYAFLRDADGRVQCGANAGAPPKRCTAPVPADSELGSWRVRVEPGNLEPVLPGQLFEVQVLLHPPQHIPWGDPLAGVDPAVRFRISDTGRDASEPLVGVLGDGTIFAQHGLGTMRSRDDGATWQDVTPVTQARTFDPMLYVDPWSGVVYVDHLYVACSNLAWSGDGGDSWVPSPAACGAPANDHQKLAVGPGPLPGMNAVYYAYSSFVEGVWVSRSLDGGMTWTSHLVAGVGDGKSARNTGPVHADREGNVYVPYYWCDGDGSVGVGVSHDMGLTWKVVQVDDEPLDCRSPGRPDADPGISVDLEGNVYVGYHRPSGVKYVVSQDRGETWSAPMVINPPGLRSFTHAAAVAGDAGKVAVAYRASADTDRGANAADGWAAWHVYVTFVEDATSESPVVTTGIVNDPMDPVQRGSICTSGVSCSGGNRNLLDFIDAEVTPDGRVVVTYADGCDGDCPTPADSRVRGMGPVAILEEGPRLFGPDGAPWKTG